MTLEVLFQACLADVNGSTVEHLETLRSYAKQAETVVEFGVDRCATSIALLHGCKGEVYSYDIRRQPEVDALRRIASGRWVFRLGDSVTATIPDCDLLYIDSWHTAEQLAAELRSHAGSVRKWIIMHDTETFGIRGEDGKPGLWGALLGWLESHPEWRIKEHHINCNGLSVLERV